MNRTVLKDVGAGLAAVALLVWSGCGQRGNPGEPAGHSHHSGHNHDHSDDHGHNAGDGHGHDAKGHTHVGPNGRRLIVLGEHQYHAELTLDHSQGAASILLFDHSGQRPLAIDQPYVMLNLLIKGRPVQVRLFAAPLPHDPAPGSSRFAGRDPSLQAEHRPRGRLSLIIGGKPFTGQIAHLEAHENLVR